MRYMSHSNSQSPSIFPPSNLSPTTCSDSNNNASLQHPNHNPNSNNSFRKNSKIEELPAELNISYLQSSSEVYPPPPKSMGGNISPSGSTHSFGTVLTGTGSLASVHSASSLGAYPQKQPQLTILSSSNTQVATDTYRGNVNAHLASTNTASLVTINYPISTAKINKQLGGTEPIIVSQPMLPYPPFSSQKTDYSQPRSIPTTDFKGHHQFSSPSSSTLNHPPQAFPVPSPTATTSTSNYNYNLSSQAYNLLNHQHFQYSNSNNTSSQHTPSSNPNLPLLSNQNAFLLSQDYHNGPITNPPHPTAGFRNAPQVPSSSGNSQSVGGAGSGNHRFIPQHSLFLGDLSYFCTEVHLTELFSQISPVVAVNISKGKSGESLLYGFIELVSEEACFQASRMLNGIEFMGRRLKINSGMVIEKNEDPMKANSIQLHFSFLSKQIKGFITEKVVREVFSQFGIVVDVVIKRYTRVPRQSRQAGYGFIYVDNQETGQRAIDYLKQNMVGQIKFDCNFTYQDTPNKGSGENQGHAKGPHPSNKQEYHLANLAQMVGQQQMLRSQSHHSLLPNTSGGNPANQSAQSPLHHPNSSLSQGHLHRAASFPNQSLLIASNLSGLNNISVYNANHGQLAQGSVAGINSVASFNSSSMAFSKLLADETIPTRAPLFNTHALQMEGSQRASNFLPSQPSQMTEEQMLMMSSFGNNLYISPKALEQQGQRIPGATEATRTVPLFSNFLSTTSDIHNYDNLEEGLIQVVDKIDDLLNGKGGQS